MDTVKTKIRYLRNIPKWETIKPFQLVGSITPGQPRHNCEFEDHDVEITDVSSLVERPVLDTWGFEWIDVAFVELLVDKESIDRRIMTLENAVLANLKAESVFSFQQMLRKRNGNPQQPHIRPPSTFAHIDITRDASLARFAFNFPTEAATLAKKRLRMISVWHPLFGPIQDNPLAFCDSRTVQTQDLVESDMVYPNFESETYMVKFNKSHRWYYKKDQMPNDVLLIVNSDSSTETRAPHTSILISENLASVERTRESFEVKMLVVG